MARAPRFSVPGNTPKLDKRFFVGLPIPPAAGLLAAVIHFFPQPLLSYAPEQLWVYSWVLLAGMALLAVLMVSRVRYTSFKNIGPKSNKPFIILPLISLLVAGIWFYSQWVLLVIASAYVAHGPLLKVWGLLGRFRPQSPKSEEATSEAPSN
jgi:CDP-diacylglycerol--serine O-phosphatidyltransferase